MLPPDVMLQDRYRVLRQIGGGGMGVVYLAEDTRLPGRRCAIKEMSPAQVALQDRDWAVEAFRQEAQMLANLSHPSLTNVTDFFPEGGNWYLVMDYVEGETLKQRLERAPGGRFSLNEALDTVRQLCEVLQYLHSQSPLVVFRDLKPSNVMVTPSGEVKLIDFGIARFFKRGQTRDTVTLGTPGYSAPEQYGGLAQTDPRSDVYSLGVVLHRMLTGYDPTTTPFRLPPPRELSKSIPPQVEAVIQQAMQMQPELRFGSVDEFCQALLAATPSQAREATTPLRPTAPIPTPRPTTPITPPSRPVTPPQAVPPRRRGRRIWIGVGIAGVVLVGLCVLTIVMVVLPALPDLFPESWGITIPYPRSAAISPEPTATQELLGQLSPTAPAPARPRIAYVRGSVGDTDIYVANADGSGPTCVACSRCDEAEPAWSPDERAIVYQSDCEGSYDIWQVSSEGGTPTRLTQNLGTDEREPDWSPDGSRILYRLNLVGQDRNADGTLWVMNADGSGAHSLGVQGRSPVWSPDGRRFAFMSERSGRWQIYVYDLDGGQTTQLTRCDTNCRWPCWSPDGQYVAYHATTGVESTVADAIWYMSASGGSPVPLVAGHQAGRPSWSVSGVVAFNSDRGIEKVDADGTGRLALTGDHQHWAPVWSR